MKQKRARIEFYTGRGRVLPSQKHRWRLVAPNGRIVASGEGFSSEAKARASWEAVQKYAINPVEYSE